MKNTLLGNAKLNQDVPLVDSKKIDRLLNILDREQERLQESLRHLDRLRECVIRRDDNGLAGLMEKLQNRSKDYALLESQRNELRKSLADDIGMSTEQTTLSRLAGLLPPELSEAVSEKRDRLRTLTEQLRAEHISTMMLLNDCAKMNSQLLRCIIKPDESKAISYDSRGKARRDSSSAFVNMKF